MDIHGYPWICIFVVMIQIIEIRVRRGRVRRLKMTTRAAKRKNVMNEAPAEGPASVQKSPTETLKKTIPTQTHQTMLFRFVYPTCFWVPCKIGSVGRSDVYINMYKKRFGGPDLDSVPAHVCGEDPAEGPPYISIYKPSFQR